MSPIPPLPRSPTLSSAASHRWPNRLRRIGWGLVGLALLGGLAALVNRVMQSDTAPKRHVLTTITTVRLPPPPPPPPPPPKAERPTEPQKMIETPKMKEPEAIKPQTERPAPAKPLPGPPPLFEGAGGAAGYGPSGSGEGGGTSIGGSGGGGSSMLAWYAGQVINSVQGALQKHEKTRTGRYKAVVKLWLDRRGAVTRAEIVTSTGNAERDEAIAQVLLGLVMAEAPPPDMPQPVQIRIGATPPA